jgi:hypothetical protein
MNRKMIIIIIIVLLLFGYNCGCSKVEGFSKQKGQKCNKNLDCGSKKCLGGYCCKINKPRNDGNDPQCAQCQPVSSQYAGSCNYCYNGYYRNPSTKWVCTKIQDKSNKDISEWGKKCNKDIDCMSKNCLGGYCCRKSLSKKDSSGNFTHPKLKNCKRCRESSNKGGKGSCADCKSGFERGSHTGWKCKAIPGYKKNKGPTDINLSNHSIDENKPGAIVGNLTASDPNNGDTVTFTLSGIDNAYFEINDSKLKLKNTVSADYEKKTSYSITITATDSGGLSVSKIFTIYVTDVNEAPTDINFRKKHGPLLKMYKNK